MLRTIQILTHCNETVVVNFGHNSVEQVIADLDAARASIIAHAPKPASQVDTDAILDAINKENGRHPGQ